MVGGVKAVVGASRGMVEGLRRGAVREAWRKELPSFFTSTPAAVVEEVEEVEEEVEEDVPTTGEPPGFLGCCGFLLKAMRNIR